MADLADIILATLLRRSPIPSDLASDLDPSGIWLSGPVGDVLLVHLRCMA